MSDNTNNGELFQKIERLTAERDALSQKLRAAQHDAEDLAATVEALRTYLVKLKESYCRDLYKSTVVERAADGKLLSEVHDFIKITPQQHLREVRAEAAIKGWWACWDWIDSDDRDKPTLIPAANQYADSVKAGEK